MSIQWTEQLAIGNDLIDGQHRELLDRFNNLLEACRKQEAREKIGELLTFLNDYTRRHFRDEEALMERHGYADRNRHREMHRGFVDRLADLQETFHNRGPSLAVIVETNQTLLNWIVGHIKSEDVKLGRFLEGAG